MTDSVLNECYHYMVPKPVLDQFMLFHRLSPTIVDAWIRQGAVACVAGTPPRVDLSLVAAAAAASKLAGVDPSNIPVGDGIVVTTEMIIGGMTMVAEFLVHNKHLVNVVVMPNLDPTIKETCEALPRIIQDDEAAVRHCYSMAIAQFMMKMEGY